MWTDYYRVAFIGHRRIEGYEKNKFIEERLYKIVGECIKNHKFVEFLMGHDGEFDEMAFSAVKRAQRVFGKENNLHILVLPYHKEDEDIWEKEYDSITYPVNSKTHFKAAICERNAWMAENCDLLVCFVERDYGGAYDMLQCAELEEAEIINIAEEIEKSD